MFIGDNKAPKKYISSVKNIILTLKINQYKTTITPGFSRWVSGIE